MLEEIKKKEVEEEWYLLVGHRVELSSRGIRELRLAEINLSANENCRNVFDVVINLEIARVHKRSHSHDQEYGVPQDATCPEQTRRKPQ